MSIEFNENETMLNGYQEKRSAGLTNMLIKFGLAKDEAGAKKVLMIIAIICFALSLYFFAKAGGLI